MQRRKKEIVPSGGSIQFHVHEPTCAARADRHREPPPSGVEARGTDLEESLKVGDGWDVCCYRNIVEPLRDSQREDQWQGDPPTNNGDRDARSVWEQAKPYILRGCVRYLADGYERLGVRHPVDLHDLAP